MKGLSAALPLLWEIAREKKLCGSRRDFIAKTRKLAGNLLPTSQLSLPEKFGPIPERLDWRSIGTLFWQGGAGAEKRKLDGSFYTPERIIDQILELLWNDLAPKKNNTATPPAICDPAMGCGFFYLRLADRLLAGGMAAASLRAWAAQTLYGVDKDAEAVVLARMLLWLTLSDNGGEFLPDPERFRCGDSLAGPGFGQTGGIAEAGGLDWNEAFGDVAAAGGFSVILGNPPYEVLTNFGRHPESRERAQALRASGWYRDSLQGQINLYRCFIERGLGLLRPGGALSFVVPLSLARDGTAAALRRRLLTREAAGDWFVYDESDALFPGVTQSACVFFARRDQGSAKTIHVRSAQGGATLTKDDLEAFGDGSLPIPEIGEDGLRLWRWLRSNVTGTLGDLAEIRVGEVDQTFYRECMRDDNTGTILARGAHLRAFWLDVTPTPGHERFLDEQLFLSMKGAAAEMWRRRVAEWRIAQLGIRNLRTRPRLVAAAAPPNVYLGNSLNVYYPRPNVDLAFLCGVLNSRLLDWMFRLGSSNNNINIKEMSGLPCPTTIDDTITGNIGLAFKKCETKARTGDDCLDERRELDRQVEIFYRVPPELIEAGLKEGCK